MMNRVGFKDTQLVEETGFNSSPATKGVLFRSVKPAALVAATEGKTMSHALDKYREFFDLAYAQGVLDRKTKHLIALGASLGSGCDP